MTGYVMTITISLMQPSDWPAVVRIYQEGIDTGNATFEPEPPVSWEEWTRRKINACSLVAREADEIVGWAALGPFSKRKVYAGVAENSLYVAAKARGKGVGSALLTHLISTAEKNGIWTIQSRIFLENTASLNLHLHHGFHRVGVLEKLGRMEFGPFKGLWRDVILIEWRSKNVGID
jgi:L-amino acid N-acyltransferase YncA